jgi:Domain of unknown function
MQIGYDTAYAQQEFMRQQTANQISKDLNSLIDDIVNFETRVVNDFEGITKLYKKIYSYLLFRNKQHIAGKYSSITLTPQISNIIEKEVAAALESVLPRAGLRPFLSLSNNDKVAQLGELANIVIGIRLFNKEISKGGIGLDSLNDITHYAARNLLNTINKEVSEIIEDNDNYAILFTIIDSLKEKVDDRTLSLLKEEVTIKRQFQMYILELKSEVMNSEQKTDGLESKYIQKVKELKDLIGNKTSIPKDQVYPRFDALSQIYSELLEEKKMSQIRSELWKILMEYKPFLTTSLSETIAKEAKLIYIEKAQQIKEAEARILQSVESTALPNNIIRLMPNSTPDFMRIPLDFLGFCIGSIATHDGLLLPGKPNMGVFKYKEKYCVFSNEKAIDEFIKNPDEMFANVTKACIKHPQLIHLLKLQDEFPKVSIGPLLQSKATGQDMMSLSAPLMVDQDIQTPVHFVEQNIVKGYCWNEWDLRRDAIHKANIRKMQTTSTQTDLSNFKHDTETQVNPPKDASTNTMKNEETNTVLQKQYMYHLRTHAEA